MAGPFDGGPFPALPYHPNRSIQWHIIQERTHFCQCPLCVRACAESSQWYYEQNTYTQAPQKSALQEAFDKLEAKMEESRRLNEEWRSEELEREARTKKLNADVAIILEFIENSNSPLLEEGSHSHEDQELVENEKSTSEEACTSLVTKEESSDSVLIPSVVEESAYFEKDDQFEEDDDLFEKIDTLAKKEEVQEFSTSCIKEEFSMVLNSDDPFLSLQNTKILKNYYEVEVIDSNSRNKVEENCMKDADFLEPTILPSMEFQEEELECKKPQEHYMEHNYFLESKSLVSMINYLELLGVSKQPPKPPWWKVKKRRKAQSKRAWILRYPP